MKTYDYDLFVIGAGSGGVRAARMASGLGVSVAIAEDQFLGGTCVNVGCVPKKLFVYASHYREDFEAASGYGWSAGNQTFDWGTLIANKDREIERLQSIYDGLLQNSGVTLINGRARLKDNHTVVVNNAEITAERILVATGGWPSIPDIPGKEFILSSNEMFHLEHLPERAVIVGGGYIAVEFAGILNGLGVGVTLCYRGPLFLRGFDDDIREFLVQEMTKKGVTLKFNCSIDAIEKSDNTTRLQLADGNTIETDLIMYATGRIPNTQDLGLVNLGMDVDTDGAIKVNENYQTNIPSIFALGDVTNRVNLTPVATAEGMALVNHLYKDQSKAVDYDNIPTAVFSQPNIGTVGLTEAEAREQYTNIDIYKSSFRPMKHTMSGINEKMLMKMIVNRDTDKVVGIHMVGDDAGEIIQGFAVAIRAGATKAIFDSTIGIHPTAAEEFVTMRDSVTA